MIYMTDFPDHKAGLSLEHDPHKSYHQTVKQWWEEMADGHGLMDSSEWVSEEQKQLAFQFNDIWVLQWYPDTPVGFCRLLAYDLNTLLKAAREGKGKK